MTDIYTEIVEVLRQQDEGSGVSESALCETFEETDDGTVLAALAALEDIGDVQRIGNGRWQAVDRQGEVMG